MNWDTFWTTFGVFSIFFCTLAVIAFISGGISWVSHRFGIGYALVITCVLIALCGSLFAGFVK